MRNSRARAIFSPDRSSLGSQLSVDLASTATTTDGPDWPETHPSALGDFSKNALNTYWRGSGNAEFIDRELEAQEPANIVVVFFHSLAPINLPQLGMSVKSGEAIVCALEGYEKRVNVEAACRRYGVPLVSSETELTSAVASRLPKTVTEAEHRSLEAQHEHRSTMRGVVRSRSRSIWMELGERWRTKDQPSNSRIWQ